MSALDLSPGPQDERRKQIHWAKVSPQALQGIILYISCIVIITLHFQAPNDWVLCYKNVWHSYQMEMHSCFYLLRSPESRMDDAFIYSSNFKSHYFIK